MWVIFLEMGIALALLILIVWFTLPRRQGKDNSPPGKDEQGPKD